MADNLTPTDTLFLGNLDQRVTTRILHDLCIQASRSYLIYSCLYDTHLEHALNARKIAVMV